MTSKLVSNLAGRVGLFISVSLIHAFTYFLLELGSPGSMGHLTTDILFTSQTISIYLYYNTLVYPNTYLSG